MRPTGAFRAPYRFVVVSSLVYFLEYNRKSTRAQEQFALNKPNFCLNQVWVVMIARRSRAQLCKRPLRFKFGEGNTVAGNYSGFLHISIREYLYFFQSKIMIFSTSWRLSFADVKFPTPSSPQLSSLQKIENVSRLHQIAHPPPLYNVLENVTALAHTTHTNPTAGNPIGIVTPHLTARTLMFCHNMFFRIFLVRKIIFITKI